MKALGHLYFLLGLGALALLALILSIRKSLARRYRLPYVADPVLFSPAQMVFLRALERGLGRDYRIYGRVRAMDAIDVRRRLDRRTRLRAWERLGGHRFDFLVCHARTSAIACAINLAPPSRLRHGVPRDALDRICDAAGLPFLRLREAESYSPPHLAEQVLDAMRARGKEVRAPEPVAPQAPEAQDDLQWLGEILVADDRRADREGARGSRPTLLGRARAATPKQPASAAKPAAPPSAPSAPSASLEPPRLEPRLTGTGDIDLGPSFRIDGDLEDEEPRARRGRA